MDWNMDFRDMLVQWQHLIVVFDNNMPRGTYERVQHVATLMNMVMCRQRRSHRHRYWRVHHRHRR